jgi:hypothetical protein
MFTFKIGGGGDIVPTYSNRLLALCNKNAYSFSTFISLWCYRHFFRSTDKPIYSIWIDIKLFFFSSYYGRSSPWWTLVSFAIAFHWLIRPNVIIKAFQQLSLTPQLEEQNSRLSLGITFDLSGMGDTTSAYATARIASRIIWPHKLLHYVEVGGGRQKIFALKLCFLPTPLASDKILTNGKELYLRTSKVARFKLGIQ